MSEPVKFDFSGDSVATGYDNFLVPVCFEPWTKALIEEHRPWTGRRVLDLATGTGVVTRLLGEEVGPTGTILGVDLNPDMLSMARNRCQDSPAPVEFMECSADSLECPDASVDFLVCQQGFQFFPDRAAAARQIHRVLTPGGRAFVSTWQPVTDCHFFGAVCEALETVGEPEISAMMRVPFDFMPSAELEAHFRAAGFQEVTVRRETRGMSMEGGVDQSVELAFATPVGPRIRGLDPAKQDCFRKSLAGILGDLDPEGPNLGTMTSDVLLAVK